jgi:hypothetical protein
MPSGHSGQVVQRARAAHRHLSHNLNLEPHYICNCTCIIIRNIMQDIKIILEESVQLELLYSPFLLLLDDNILWYNYINI